MSLSRRTLLLSAAALAACQRHDTASAPAVSGGLRTVRGKHLYVESYGSADAPAVLYLHGGPGAGSYDFGLTQSARLAPRVRLILLDQRGVLRSAPLTEADTCTLDDLVEDAEALRQELGIERWSLIGHSFGGFLALRYALDYPDRVARVVFENPSWDLQSSARELLRGAASEYRTLGDVNAARACEQAAAAEASPRETWERFTELSNGLGAARNNLYVHGPEKDFFERIVANSGLPSELWARGGEHQRRLMEEGAVFTPIAPRLTALRAPALLIHGAYDRVTAPDQVAAFTAGDARTLATFAQSSHFAHYEEQDLYAQTVADFLTA